jgi:hypothetical protein
MPDPALSHAHETLLWASKGGGSRHTFNYDLINSTDTTVQLSSVWQLVFDPFCRSGTTEFASKELGRFFVGAEKEEEYAELAARRVGASERGEVLRELPDLSARDS